MNRRGFVQAFVAGLGAALAAFFGRQPPDSGYTRESVEFKPKKEITEAWIYEWPDGSMSGGGSWVLTLSSTNPEELKKLLEDQSGSDRELFTIAGASIPSKSGVWGTAVA